MLISEAGRISLPLSPLRLPASVDAPVDRVSLGAARPAHVPARPPEIGAPKRLVAPEDLPLNREPFRLSHDLRVRLYPDRGEMVGDDRMVISRLPYDQQANFLLSPELSVRDVTIDGARVPYRREDDRIEVDLRDVAEAGDSVRLRVRYDGRLPGKENGPGASGTYLYDESWWHPSHHGVHGRARLTVSMPAEWTATASAGEQSTEVSGGWRTTCWETPWAGAGLSLAAARYDVTAEERDGRQLRAFLFPGSSANAQRLIDKSAGIIRYFTPLFGSYPYDHLDIAESNTEGAGGVPSLILFQPGELTDEEGLDDFLAHELSHNWWAGALAGYTADGLWYEAFAEYSANLYTRGSKDSPRAVREREAVLSRWHDEIGAPGATPLREVRSYDPWEEKSLVAYYKGAFVLDMLRDRLGDDAFFGGLRTFVQQQRGHFTSWSDAQSAFESASGEDLSTFFGQWLDRGDAPSLALQQVHTTAVPGGWQLDGAVQQVQSGDPYDLDVPVIVKTRDGQVFRKSLPMGDRQGTFSWTLPAPPTEVQIDPESRLFRLKNDQEVWIAGQAPPPVTLSMQS